MGDQTQKYGRKMIPRLDPGETLLVAAKCVGKGGAGDLAAIGGGLVGGLVSGAFAKSAAAKAPAVGTIADRVPKKAAVVAVTNKRLLFFALNDFGAIKADRPVALIECAEVTSLLATKSKVVRSKLAVGFRDGSEILLELLSAREVPSFNAAAAEVLGAR
jgi:hypothetical protein